MKFFCVILTVLLLLCGCSAEPTFETLGPVLDHQGTAEPKRISVLLPADAAATVMAGGNGKLYFCDGYEVMAETLEAGNLKYREDISDCPCLTLHNQFRHRIWRTQPRKRPKP